MTQLITRSDFNNKVSLFNQELLDEIQKVKDAMFLQRKILSESPVPKSKIGRFGDKKPIVRWEDLEYVSEDWMRETLSAHFIWSWEGCGAQPLQISYQMAQVAFTGTLEILENGLVRKFTACGGARIKIKKGENPAWDTIVDFGNDCSAANTKAFKKAINMLTNIGDPVYGKEMSVSTKPEYLKEITQLILAFQDESEKNSIAQYLLENYGGAEHVPDDAAVSIINNLKARHRHQYHQYQYQQNQ